jgi:hypothetical protein
MVMSDYSQNTVSKLINHRVDSREVYPHLTIRSVKVKGVEGINNRGPPFNLFLRQTLRSPWNTRPKKASPRKPLLQSKIQ